MVCFLKKHFQTYICNFLYAFYLEVLVHDFSPFKYQQIKKKIT